MAAAMATAPWSRHPSSSSSSSSSPSPSLSSPYYYFPGDGGVNPSVLTLDNHLLCPTRNMTPAAPPVQDAPPSLALADARPIALALALAVAHRESRSPSGPSLFFDDVHPDESVSWSSSSWSSSSPLPPSSLPVTPVTPATVATAALQDLRAIDSVSPGTSDASIILTPESTLLEYHASGSEHDTFDSPDSLGSFAAAAAAAVLFAESVVGPSLTLQQQSSADPMDDGRWSRLPVTTAANDDDAAAAAAFAHVSSVSSSSPGATTSGGYSATQWPVDSNAYGGMMPEVDRHFISNQSMSMQAVGPFSHSHDSINFLAHGQYASETPQPFESYMDWTHDPHAASRGQWRSILDPYQQMNTGIQYAYPHPSPHPPAPAPPPPPPPPPPPQPPVLMSQPHGGLSPTFTTTPNVPTPQAIHALERNRSAQFDARTNLPRISSRRTSPYDRPVPRTVPSSTTPPPPPSMASRRQNVSESPPSSSNEAGPSTQVAFRATSRSTSSNTPPLDPLANPSRRGGRKKDSHLPEQVRQRSHQMRKVAACWRCAIQRDTCDGQKECGRCQMHSQKGQAFYFPCDRSKLPHFIGDLLPDCMKYVHERRSIEALMQQHILDWDSANPITVWLTTGYGPPLQWTVFEFKPKSQHPMGQQHYEQDSQTGKSVRVQKYAPPFALRSLDVNDSKRFSAYIDLLLKPEYLSKFGSTFYHEETLGDPGAFQAQMLQLLCNFYLDTDEQDLKQHLREILRMLLITFLMGRVLCFEENTLHDALSRLKFTSPPRRVSRKTSPRVANRQLKFFFHTLRTSYYERMLKWQQQTMRTSGKKMWLPAFCTMLGFAMVLEELQRTLCIQAAAKIEDPTTYDHNGDRSQAFDEARDACSTIDNRFDLVLGIFQCKYRDRKWPARGTFGYSSPDVREQISNRFLSKLFALTNARAQHLESRRHVELALENEHLLTSRLTARFLLPFLQPPR